MKNMIKIYSMDRAKLKRGFLFFYFFLDFSDKKRAITKE